MSEDSSSVRVAVRIRPPLTREVIDGCQTCTSVSSGTPQVWIGGNHAFTYDYVFDSDSSQDSVFQTVTGLVDGCMDGYNATILAYGQTGSGKTYTMGTGFDVEALNYTSVNENQGIIPRAVYYLFSKIEERRQDASEAGRPPPDFKVSAQFVELYNEEVFDLIESESRKGTIDTKNFRPLSSPPSETDLPVTNKMSANGVHRRPQTTGSIKIHEDPTGGIYIVGIGTKSVESAAEAMKCLRNGALSRTTASTNMNDQSSRSHAIFTLHIKQQRVVGGDEPESQSEFETLTAKFHFVDLAGSERLKRTGAVGERAKEGISINCGLLALGNVISALGDVSKRVQHVPYRDSKLTRLLQDSLGGNSRTVMITCVSPCDRDFVETLNSLKYANRARNIKNRITVNQDKSSRTIAILKQEIQSLQNELLDWKQGKRTTSGGSGSGCGEDETSDTWHENVMLHTEVANLKNRVKALQETVEILTAKNADLLAERVVASTMQGNGPDVVNCDLTNLVKGYMQEIEELRAKLCEAEATCEAMRKSLTPRPNLLSPRPHAGCTTTTQENINDLIEEAKKEVEKEEDLVRRLQNTCDNSDSNSNDEDDGDLDDDDDDDEDDTENERQQEKMISADIKLANVTNDISVKLRLIEQLETSQRRMEAMKAQYEEKLLCLSHKIKATETERDKVLSQTKGEVKLKQTKEDYEKRLSSMNAELKKWQNAQKEHAKVLRNQGQFERQIGTLKTEIENMKRVKVKLMNQIKEDGIKWREIESKRVKEINQLKKDQRKKDIAIRALEGEARMKDLVLKRKHEEVNALKKNKAMSAKAQGRLHHQVQVKVSPVKAKQRWGRIMGTMVKNVTTKQTLTNFEQEMMSLFEERKLLKTEVDGLMKEKVKLQMEMGSPDSLHLINDDIENLNAKMTYVEEKINEIQMSIVELTGAREEEEQPDLSNLVSKLNQQEIHYVFNKLYEQSVASMTECANATKRETEAREKFEHYEKELNLTRDLLQHVMITHQDGILVFPPEVAAKLQCLKTDYRYNPSHGSTESLPSSSNGSDTTFVKPSAPAAPRTDRKARRITATPSELLMGSSSNGAAQLNGIANGVSNDTTFVVDSNETSEVVPPLDEFRRVNSVRGSFRTRRNTYTVNSQGEFAAPSTQPQTLLPPATATTSLTDSNRCSTNNSNRKPGIMVSSSVSRIKAANNMNSADRLNTTFLTDKSDRSPEHDRYESPNNTPPGSPNSQRRAVLNNDNNVFQRLFGGSEKETGGVGVIRPVRSSSGSRSLLINVSVAEGHSKPVLSVFATEDKLITGSKDSTAKVWDLTTGKELQTLAGHPNNVLCVKYVEDRNLVLTTSHCYIKVWDIRLNSKSNCIRTLCSSAKDDSGFDYEPNSRVNVFPAGEYVVNCVCVGARDMYTPYGDRVRRWDLRKFQSVGLLPGRHGSAVTCMALDENSFVTGSKDHLIKVYEVPNPSAPELNGSGTNTWTLEPPHYDGIETFAMSNRVLFSGSRDTCIKRWDLHRKEMVTSINNAHGSWITGLAFAPKNDSILLSSGRDGFVKLWSVNDCRELGKVDAHKGVVNCLTTNSTLIFTGSHDGFVSIWKMKKSLDVSPEGSDISP